MLSELSEVVNLALYLLVCLAAGFLGYQISKRA